MAKNTVGVSKKPLDLSKFYGRTLMGYNSNEQKAKGHSGDLNVRAFLFSDGTVRSAIVVADIWTCTFALRAAVIQRVERGPFADKLPTDNILITATHTHAGPSGLSDMKLYSAMTGGYSAAIVDHIADTIYEALEEAYDNYFFVKIEAISARPTDMAGRWYGQRSLQAYNQNPEAAAAPADSIDQNDLYSLRGLRFRHESGTHVAGALFWLPFHNTALGNTNKTLCGDIYGYAAEKIETELNSKSRNLRPVVVGLLNGASGDISPNMLIEKGKLTERISPRGTKLITALGNRVATAATRACGHVNVDCATHKDFTFTDVTGQMGAAIGKLHVEDWQGAALRAGNSNARQARTYPGAIGLATFAGSSVDGEGPIGLEEGITRTGISWSENLAKDLLQYVAGRPGPHPSAYHIPHVLLSSISFVVKALAPLSLGLPHRSEPYWDGQGEKPIVFMTGDSAPREVPIQILTIGKFMVAGFPGEISHTACHRLRLVMNEAVAGHSSAACNWMALCACSNAYSQYVTTPEEYSAQHYEGSSTLFGPDTLYAYIGAFRDLLDQSGLMDRALR